MGAPSIISPYPDPTDGMVIVANAHTKRTLKKQEEPLRILPAFYYIQLYVRIMQTT